MPATASPFGLVPLFLAGGSPAGVMREFTLTTNTASAFYQNCVVNVGAGVITPISATPTTTRNGASPTGIFMQVTYFTSTTRVQANYFPANGYTSYSAYGPITMLVYDNPDIEFLVQASGSVAYTAVGKNAELSGFSGSTVNGQSSTTVDSATINTTNTFGLKIVDIGPGPLNAAGDAYTNLVCRWNANVHPYRNILGV